MKNPQFSPFPTASRAVASRIMASRAVAAIFLGASTFSLAAPRAFAQSPTTPNPTGTEKTAQVKVCQVGYLPQETKFAFVTSAATGNALIRRVTGAPALTSPALGALLGATGQPQYQGADGVPLGPAVLSVPVGAAALDPDSGDSVSAIDFSALKTPGTYVIEVPGVGTSYPFRIGADAFARPFRLAMRAFTGQRCGTDVSLAPDFPQFHYDACHTELSQFHPSSGKTGTLEATGGWHDAGDFGRYIVNSGISTGTLLWAFELNEPKLRSLNLDVPESNNTVPDMLDEIRWNIDWMLKMQDADGGVWHKETTAGFPGFIMPAQDKAVSLIIGNAQEPFKTTAATGDFAAVCAIAGRVFRAYDAVYADKCLDASKRAWTWLQTHPDNNYQQQPQGISTGGYGDGNPADERLWAAAELFRTTAEAPYNAYFLANYEKWAPTLAADKAQGWGDVHNMAMFTYALSSQPNTDQTAATRIKTDAVAAADGIAARTGANLYRVPMAGRDYNWGSNSNVANYAMMLQIAHRFAPKRQYLDSAQDALHYLLGRNTFNTSFVTQVGSRWPMHPHHRPSAADGVEQPWPGMLVGGPNANRKPLPARQWFDVEGDYTTNEIAINWNAPLVFALAGALPEPA